MLHYLSRASTKTISLQNTCIISRPKTACWSDKSSSRTAGFRKEISISDSLFFKNSWSASVQNNWLSCSCFFWIFPARYIDIFLIAIFYFISVTEYYGKKKRVFWTRWYMIGRGRIRTHGPLQDFCFQDRRNRPLCHPSKLICNIYTLLK